LEAASRVTLRLSSARAQVVEPPMTQSSEDRLPDEAASSSHRTAQILPFERPRSELQKAVQVRAQEALDRDRDRAREAKKISPLRAIIIFAIAAIPVYLMFSAVNGFVSVLHRVNAIIDEQPPTPATPVVEQPPSSDPNVVILVNPTDAKAVSPTAGSTPQNAGGAPSRETSR
jgi:hypothetical protein